MIVRQVLLACLSVAACSAATCPMMGDIPEGHPYVPRITPKQTDSAVAQYIDKLNDIDFDKVTERIEEVLTDSKDAWPADFGNYGPFFIRLAWHCAGSYRNSDGRGGCDGGRIRHAPEADWEDNGNLDKALDILRPVKEEFGEGLSWGDLIVLAGNTAIKSMGGPLLGFCGGRLDDANGDDSLQLGPSDEQEEDFPCLKPDGTPDTGNSQCQAPLGAIQVGLIYVNPAGPVNADGTRNPDPVASGVEIREVFGRMGFDDEMTVAVVGGGHAFGKCHGGGAVRNDGNAATVTSGFEGQWTLTPTVWTNDYFKALFQFEDDWELWNGPNGDAGSVQWRIAAGATGRTDAHDNIMMLTSDLAMIKDPAYRVISQRFADDITALEEAFGKAWYALMSRDMGPWKRCVGAPSGDNKVPAVQDWQLNLPEPADSLPDFDAVRSDIKSVMTDDDIRDEMAYLAFRCAATYRYTDHLGGCNGALIRYPPQSGWVVNTGLDQTRALLQDVYNKYDDNGLTWADLITLAGVVAVEEAGANHIDYCGGMTDVASNNPNFATNALATSGPNERLKWRMELMGLTTDEVVALQAMPRNTRQMEKIGREGSWATTNKGVSNEYFSVLLSETWEMVAGSANPVEYKAAGKDIYITEHDKEILDTPKFKTAAEKFRDNEATFKTTFSAAWSKIAHNSLLKSSYTPDDDGGAGGTDLDDDGDVDGGAGMRVPSMLLAAFAAVLALARH